MEIQDSPFQPLPPLGLEDPGGHPAQRGVGHVHGGAGAGLDHLHPGHHLVQQVDPMAHTQRVSHVALETQTQLDGQREFSTPEKMMFVTEKSQLYDRWEVFRCQSNLRKC